MKNKILDKKQHQGVKLSSLVLISFVWFVCLCFVNTTLACNGADQFRVFPVGICQQGLVSYDVIIHRMFKSEAYDKYHLDVKTSKDFDDVWVLIGRISIYDKNGKLLSSKTKDTLSAVGKSYHIPLQKGLSKAILDIKQSYRSIELLSPSHISFYPLKKKTKIVSLYRDSVADRDFEIYRNKRYDILCLKDTSLCVNKDNSFCPQNVDMCLISSIRIYKSATKTIVITHIQTSEEIRMDLDLKNIRRKIKFDKPNFKRLDQTAFCEPLLNHGYGFDLLIQVNEKRKN